MRRIGKNREYDNEGLPMALSNLLAQPVAKIPETFRDVEKLRKVGHLTKLPESLVTLGDVKKVVSYLTLRSRITIVGPCEVEILVPTWSVTDVQYEMDYRRLFGTKITVRPLGFWDHIFLWCAVVRSKVPQ
jgi:hypothetical protein